MRILFFICIALLIQLHQIHTLFAVSPSLPVPHQPIIVQPASPESAINIPKADILPIEPVDERFEVRVIAKGALAGGASDMGLLAVHPETQEIFFTEFDYRDQFYPKQLFSTAPNSRQIDIKHLDELTVIPSVEIEQTNGPEQYAFYAERMDVDSNGNVFLIQQNAPINRLRTDKVIQLDSGLNAQYHSIGDICYFMDIKVVRSAIPEWNLIKDDILVLIATINQNHIPSQIMALRKNADGYQVDTLLETDSFAFAVAGDAIYTLDHLTLDLVQHRPNHKSVLISLKNIISDRRTQLPQLEYLHADHAFYIMDSYGKKLVRVAEDGMNVSSVIEETQLTQITASPDGNVLYTVVQHLPFLGSIQALYLKVSMDATRTLSALEAGDFNGDSQQNVSDVDILLHHYLLDTPLTEIDRIFMDINRDGALTPQDAQDYWQQLSLQN